MFTGIITHKGTLKRIEKSGDWRIVIAADNFTKNMAIGASVSCSGVCLTVIEKTAQDFTVQVSDETLFCTTLKTWQEGVQINLERALKVGDEFGGHFVSGHVDGLAILKGKEQIGDSWKIDFSHPKELSRFIAAKGSIVLDGVSLTVNQVSAAQFSVNIIPHTLIATTLGERKIGEAVNLEIDIIARYIERQNEQ
jgi:riboflavin synthase